LLWSDYYRTLIMRCLQTDMASPSTVRIIYLMKVTHEARKLAHIDDLRDMGVHKY
jgi:hypothetical protein